MGLHPLGRSLSLSNNTHDASHIVRTGMQKGEWTSVEVPFSSFRPVFRARSQPDAPPLDPSHITSLQLMLSKFEYDGELNPHFSAGRFELPLKDVCAYMPAGAAPRFIHISSAGATRCACAALACNVCFAIALMRSYRGLHLFKQVQWSAYMMTRSCTHLHHTLYSLQYISGGLTKRNRTVQQGIEAQMFTFPQCCLQVEQAWH